MTWRRVLITNMCLVIGCSLIGMHRYIARMDVLTANYSHTSSDVCKGSGDRRCGGGGANMMVVMDISLDFVIVYAVSNRAVWLGVHIWLCN